MERLSVKKPFTILVAALIIIALGGVSLSKLQMDLLPEISLPYVIVVTAYPGASPEKVEEQLTGPLENALGTISGVENVMSTSAENYSMVQLEFADGTDMNTAMVRVSSALNQIESSLPEGSTTPNIIEISMDMLATMYVAVEREGYDIYQLSDFVNYDVIPEISREEGVASINTIGLVEKSILVELNKDKIDALNDRILTKTNDKLAEAQEKLDEAKEKLDDAQKKLEEAQAGFGSTMSGAIFDNLDKQAPGIAKNLKKMISDLKKQLEGVAEGIEGLQNEAERRVAESEKAVAAAKKTLDDANADLTEAQQELDSANAALAQAQQALDDYMSRPDADPSSDEYKELEAAVNTATENAAKAKQNVSDKTGKVTSATEVYKTAMDELTAANLAASGLSDEQIAQTVASIDQIIDMLDQMGAEIDGSSFNRLLATTRRMVSAITQITQLLQAVQTMDVSGIMQDSLKRVNTTLDSLTNTVNSIPQMLKGLEKMFAGLTQGQLDAAVGFATAANQLSDAQAQLDMAQAQYDKAKEAALKNANADALISPQTLSQLIYAQNFSMPVGYIDDKDDNSWLLRVGEEFGSSEEISTALLIDNEIIGSVKLEDIADVTVIDNSGDSLSRLNGNDTIVLCVYKSSSVGTNDVSRNCNRALKELEKKYPGTHTVNLVDQGDYISMIVESVLQSMIIGAILAIIILAIFLKDFKPTLVVAISIPMSVLLAIVLMYFTGLELNVMTLSGLSLGIGMLVDNSVVVMENIFRLRGTGMSAPRAAVQGAKQVRGAIIASTLTTVCVFLPAVFASGTVRTLLYPMAMSIGFCLVGSLVIALTVVPASSSTLMKNTKPKEHKLFEKVVNGYGKSLAWCLKHKFIPLLIAVVLLAFSVWEVFRMGIVYIPEIVTNEINISIETPEEMTREESYAEAEAIMNKILTVEGVENVGLMDSGSTLGFFGGGLGGNSQSYGRYTCNALMPEGTSAEKMKAVSTVIEEQLKDFPGEIKVSAAQMMDASALSGSSGYAVNIYGDDYKELERISGDVRKIFEAQQGIEEITDNFTDGADTLQVVIDRDKAMGYGLTVAQIYAEIMSHTTEKVKATTITVNGTQMNVEIVDDTDTLTKETLMDIEFEEVDMTQMAGASGSGDMSSFDSMGDMSSMMNGDKDEEDSDKESDDKPKTHKLSEFATVIETKTSNSRSRKNLAHYVTVSSSTVDGYNTTLISREIQPKIDQYAESLPDGYSIEVAGESTQVMEMVVQMLEMAALALLFVYLIMVAQFQSLLSPFIIMFTIPLAFTGGMLGLLIGQIQLSMLSMLGFVILMGTVVNNGIVFVDYANQLRIGGLERHDALIATGKTRMRPILMTALTTILAMSMMIFGTGMSTQLGRGMAVVIAGGLIYATLMTLYIVPIVYDILFKRKPLNVDVGDDIEEVVDDAAQYIAEMEAARKAEEGNASENIKVQHQKGVAADGSDDNADQTGRSEGPEPVEGPTRPGGSGPS